MELREGGEGREWGREGGSGVRRRGGEGSGGEREVIELGEGGEGSGGEREVVELGEGGVSFITS